MKVYLLEAKPDSIMTRGVWYHGARSRDPVSKLRGGIQPRKAIGMKKKPDEDITPAGRKVYLTRSLALAKSYAHSAMHKGDSHERDDAEYKSYGKGFVAVVRGSSLKNVDPDEDHVSRLLTAQVGPKTFKHVASVVNRVKKHAVKKLGRAFIDKHVHPEADYGTVNTISKFIIRSMSPKLKRDIINSGGGMQNIAHVGPVKPHYLMKVDQSDRLMRDHHIRKALLRRKS